MQITLIKSNSIKQFTLPEKVQGQYWLTHTTDRGVEEKLFSIEAAEGKWRICSTSKAELYSQGNSFLRELTMETMHFYSVHIRTTGENAFIYTEPLTNDRRIFRKFITPANGCIRIGRADDNDIVYKNPFVSGHNAELTIRSGEFYLDDRSSRNGTFVNGIKSTHNQLRPGDTIYIMGLKILIGRGFISVNCPDLAVRVNGGQLRPFIKQPVEEFMPNDRAELKPATTFFRSPRFKRDIETAIIEIDPPPQKANEEQMPLIYTVGPSATMGIASLTMAAVTITNLASGKSDLLSSLPSIMMAVAMLAGTLLWPTLIKKYERRKKGEREDLRQHKYTEYLRDVERKIAGVSAYQHEVMCENYVSLDNCLSRIKLMQRNLWERTVNHNDFLVLRAGTGNVPLDAEMHCQKRKFSLDVDNLLEMQYGISEREHMLHNVPITVNLTANQITGIIGPREKTVSLAKSLIMQAAALHSYDEVKMVFIYDPYEADQWAFAKWLPHAWTENHEVRLVAENESDLKDISSYLERELEQKNSARGEYSFDNVPHYIIFALSQTLCEKPELLKKIYKEKEYRGFSVVAVSNEINNLPKETRMVIDLSARSAKMYDKDDTGRNYIEFIPEFCDAGNIEEYSSELANIELDTSVGAFQLPTLITFLEMYGASKVEYLNIHSRWRENDCTASLEAPIGVDENGELFKLDVHERFHGPHGLIAGTTGSGKSEFIMTYILSMALNYHPDEVAFILIDYKGGGMAKAFEHLPHTAGIITNLDGAEVKRSLVSINSELKRRQAVLNDACKRTGMSNIDIYKYQKLYREGTVREPLPHLLIISDEFAELKQQQHEFMAELISAARIGRSLGVHLILATQKPSGVVDDQITSNARFKICLKVQDRQDSMEMLQRPEAAGITDKGRFYLQVGNNEIFMLGQSAWSGAAYAPSDKIEKNVDDSIAILTNTGRIVRQVRPSRGTRNNYGSQLDCITAYISKLAEEEGIRTRQLWCAPMHGVSTLEEITRKYGAQKKKSGIIEPLIGEYDLPEMQTQKALTLPLTERGNVVVYGATGSGKTTFMTTLVYSLIENYTPDQVNIYILDFLSQTLTAFSNAPHVGDVMVVDNGEKIDNLFKMLFSELRTRRQLFQEFGGDYTSFIKHSGRTVPAIVVAVHNYTGLVETYEDKEEAIAQLSRDGNKYGIYFVLSAVSISSLRHKTQQNFGQQYMMQMNDSHDYSSIFGYTGGMVPSKYKGRGLFKPSEIYEYQIAYCTRDGDEFRYIRDYCRDKQRSWHGAEAKAIPILPDFVNIDFMRRYIAGASAGSLPVGVDKERLTVVQYPLLKNILNWVITDASSFSLFAQGLAETAAMKDGLETVVFDPDAMFLSDVNRGYTYYSQSGEVNSGVNSLFEEILRRHKVLKDNPDAEFGCLLCIINSMNSLLNTLDKENAKNFNDALTHMKNMFNVHFVVCDLTSFYNTAVMKDWAKDLTSPRDVIFIGNGIIAQYKLKIEKKPAGLRDMLDNGFGVVVQNGTAAVVKLLTPQSWLGGEDELDG